MPREVKLKPLALDLCCGKGGWTIGLMKTGWDVIGVDIEAWEGYPGKLILGDIRTLDIKKHLKGRKVSLVCASPPCQEFSYRSFPFKRCRELAKNVPPDKSIWEACVRIAKEVGAPLILENVRGAEPYMGRAKFHCGAFYLWGDVPALLPTVKTKKGFVSTHRIKIKKRMAGEYERSLFVDEAIRTGSHPKARKEWSAKIAMIPIELSTWIGKVFHPDWRSS